MYTSQTEIESFLKEYERSRVIMITSVRAVLNRAPEFEQKFHKPFYQFTTDEILEMYKSARAISNRSLQNANLILKPALFGQQIYYCDVIQIINTDDKTGLILRGQEIYVSKHDAQYTEIYESGTYIVGDRLLQIIVKCK